MVLPVSSGAGHERRQTHNMFFIINILHNLFSSPQQQKHQRKRQQFFFFSSFCSRFEYYRGSSGAFQSREGTYQANKSQTRKNFLTSQVIQNSSKNLKTYTHTLERGKWDKIHTHTDTHLHTTRPDYGMKQTINTTCRLP